MIELLHLGKQLGWPRLRQAIETALELGCTDAAAVEHLVRSESLQHTRSESVELGELQRYERPLPVLSDYDHLLTEVVQ
jgi:hypothetical protein